MVVFIKGGTVVTGDGGLIKKGTVVFKDDRIAEVTDKNIEPPSEADVVDVSGQVVMPGIINNHANGIIFGAPLFGTGSLPLSDEQTLANLNKHLLQGTTTILNVDGFATMDQVNSTRARHPIRIETSTIHTPLNIKAAYASDGQGMLPQNIEPTAKEMLEEGAVALAEVGDGGTLGGAGQDYIFIPRAVKKATGIDISTDQARALKFAVLGKHIDPPQFDEDSVYKLCQQFGLQGRISVSGIKALIENTVLPSFKIAVEGMLEAGQLA
ncbi:MAG: hypothetical protein GX207_04855 [Peptococcaceae bacterium]|nr:hypothetical protein [Peptococcaceae bacterium]